MGRGVAQTVSNVSSREAPLSLKFPEGKVNREERKRRGVDDEVKPFTRRGSPLAHRLVTRGSCWRAGGVRCRHRRAARGGLRPRCSGAARGGPRGGGVCSSAAARPQAPSRAEGGAGGTARRTRRPPVRVGRGHAAHVPKPSTCGWIRGYVLVAAEESVHGKRSAENHNGSG